MGGQRASLKVNAYNQCLQKGPILRTWSLTKTFLHFGSLLGPHLHISQGPYFYYFGFIHAKIVNLSHIFRHWFYFTLIFTYAYALIFIHRRLGSLFLLLRVLIGSLFHKKMGPCWALISKLGGLYQF